MKTQIQLLVVLVAAAFVFGCEPDPKKTKEETTVVTEETVELATATADLDAKSGSKVDGTINFKEMADGQVMLTLTATGLTPGVHAVHIHENGDCSADDGSSAGGHWNPTGEDHGKWGHDEHHLGDIGNLDVGDDGTANLTFTTDRWSLNATDSNSIINKAVIIHAGEDDFTSQPTGNAGGREACGVIQ